MLGTVGAFGGLEFRSVPEGTSFAAKAVWPSRAADAPQLHIGFVIEDLRPGGAERLVNLLCNHFAAQGAVVTLFTFEDRVTHQRCRYHPAVRMMPLGLARFPAGRARRAFRAWRRIGLLRKALQVAAPDVVVSLLSTANICTVVAARRLGIPVIVTERNACDAGAASRLRDRLRIWLYPQASALVTTTRAAMDRFSAGCRRAWIIATPAVPPARGGAERRETRTIAAVGALVQRQGFDDLLDAFGIMAADHPDWRLVIWGDGPERAALERQRRQLGLDDCVEFRGEGRGCWSDEADLLVLASNDDAGDWVLGEAIASAIPVISFDGLGAVEMIEPGEGGLLVRRGEVRALAAELSALCTDAAARHAQARRAARSAKTLAPQRILEQWDSAIAAVRRLPA